MWVYSQHTAQSAPPQSTCPPHKPRVYCLIDPCRFAECPAHPDAQCVSDYCGGCNAKFFEDKDEVTDTCREYCLYNQLLYIPMIKLSGGFIFC